MRRLVQVAMIAATVALGSSVLAQRPADARAPHVSDRVRSAAQGLYIHGVTDQLAHSLLGPEDVSDLLTLLADPGFPRRDNVVALLAYLGDARARDALLRHLAGPPAALGIPEEERALLIAPEALGRMAARGDDDAFSALLSLTEHAAQGGPLARRAPGALRDDLIEQALRGLAFSRRPRAKDRLTDIGFGRVTPNPQGRPLSSAALDALELFRESEEDLPGAPQSLEDDGASGGRSAAQTPPDAAASDVEPLLDPAGRAHDSGLTYANHATLTSLMTDSRLDQVMSEASLRAGRTDYSGDLACCATVSRSGVARTFGASGTAWM